MVNLSERTLKRCLCEDGATFTVILSEYKKGRAMALMADVR